MALSRFAFDRPVAPARLHLFEGGKPSCGTSSPDAREATSSTPLEDICKRCIAGLSPVARASFLRSYQQEQA